MPSLPNPSFERYQKALKALELPAFKARVPGAPFVVALEGPNGAGKRHIMRKPCRFFGRAFLPRH